MSLPVGKIYKVLIACEFSGITREAFKAKGYDAWSCDLLPTEIPGQHIQGDVLEILDDGWDLMIAHPPCTYLCNSGVRWLYNANKSKNLDRWGKMIEAALFYKTLIEAKIPKKAVENPIMHKYAVEIIGRRQDQIIQPWQFGHGEIKATGLRLEGLPKLKPTNIVEGREARIHNLPPSKDRGKLRSITYQGIADAMAEQWDIAFINKNRRKTLFE